MASPLILCLVLVDCVPTLVILLFPNIRGDPTGELLLGDVRGARAGICQGPDPDWPQLQDRIHSCGNRGTGTDQRLLSQGPSHLKMVIGIIWPDTMKVVGASCAHM